ncbi:Bgt-5230 [Blumeria graminis f. sp. tritici]|uniref:Bgt-5230 n=3 Tax=Blumeria graminis TaxID=34373 RepID=A0A9X9MMH9_BLUGR|nr:hypothetical protein BGT96224_5230 [Blumeria graminis f. sp. tritici 96224]VDB93335.1 Bgt-5230 [Blumeria graminis f. sp. tritici]
MSLPGRIRIAIDRGGTFTDCIGNPGSGNAEDNIVVKLLSEDPSNYEDAPLEGIRRILSKFRGKEITRNEILDTSDIESIRMGTTVATNALLERKGERIAMIVTKGFKDCLKIGNQTRPKIFDLSIKKPDILYEKIIEIDERVTLEDYSEDPTGFISTVEPGKLGFDNTNLELVKGLSSEIVRIISRPQEHTIRKQLQDVYDLGIRSIAVCLMHAYTFPNHEVIIGLIADEIGFTNVSLSHQLMPMIKFLPRATSTCVDAYLTPVIKKYIAGFQKRLKENIENKGIKKESDSDTRCEFMQSDGGLVHVQNFSGLKAILSGPAGGVVGYAMTSYDSATKIPVIGFDMGGTSTDVSRYGSGRYDHVFETTTAGVTILSPQLDINTVAAGGGSCLFFRNGLFVVGPESAGAHPGPACYRKGGPATVTDANLVLGLLRSEFFPKIFGKNEDEGLDVIASKNKLNELAEQISKETKKPISVDETALGFLKVANEAMTRPIRSLTEAKGYDVSKHRLATFGGAGGQHAVAIAQSLGIREILVHRYSSVLSAYGMSLADIVIERQEPASEIWNDDDFVSNSLEERILGLGHQVISELRQQGFDDNCIEFEQYLNMRYKGTESALMIMNPEVVNMKKCGRKFSFGKAFIQEHRREYGFEIPDREIIIDDIRIRGKGKNLTRADKTVDKQLEEIKIKDLLPGEKEFKKSSIYFDGHRQITPIYRLEGLDIGDKINGPAIIADQNQTIVVSPGATSLVINTHVVITVDKKIIRTSDKEKMLSEEVDPIQLSIFSHRFMAIAEQMGRALQKTSISTNIKERLDYSCALFDADGGLVANAPHLPVHLGSMSTCIQKQAEIWRDKLVEGDVIVSNHPEFGGTHLPDITVITPAFDLAGEKIIFYVASRAHHADIGGILPGSMPPYSRELYQEGAAIKSELLVRAGIFNEARIIQLLLKEPAKYPDCSGTRCLSDNLSDLKAQIASNKKGIDLISALIEEYGENTVNLNMMSIQKNAESSVRNLLKDVSRRFERQELSAIDYMDDGSPIKLRVTINSDKGEAVFDFTGTGSEVYANTNAPTAITYSAVIYCLRCLISQDIPLNQGCLKPIKVIIPPRSLLSPSEKAAVVGGNVLTSQRITDVILKAFKACAASQGDCNNLTFGFGSNSEGQDEIKGFGYYETIAGGSGAGEDWHGTSGVHTHMTNTRITDAEIFERRYPVLLREFSIREGSGGAGKYRGGNGLIRDIEFRRSVLVSILSERRVYHPYGMSGGSDAKCGLNIWVRKVVKGDPQLDDRPIDQHSSIRKDVIYEERRINLGGKNTAAMQAGERIIIHTPGGGGWGVADRFPL